VHPKRGFKIPFIGNNGGNKGKKTLITLVNTHL
jgi:hypothetical protein